MAAGALADVGTQRRDRLHPIRIARHVIPDMAMHPLRALARHGVGEHAVCPIAGDHHQPIHHRPDHTRRVAAPSYRRFAPLSASARVFARAGFGDSARAILSLVERRPDAVPYDLAMSYAALKDTLKTIELLERAVAEGGDEAFQSLQGSGDLAFLRGVPRFERLLARAPREPSARR